MIKASQCSITWTNFQGDCIRQIGKGSEHFLPPHAISVTWLREVCRCHHASSAVNKECWLLTSVQFIGYAAFYMTRLSVGYAAPSMIEDPTLGLDMKGVGGFTSILPTFYGISKFLSGVLGARTSPTLLLAGKALSWPKCPFLCDTMRSVHGVFKLVRNEWRISSWLRQVMTVTNTYCILKR